MIFSIYLWFVLLNMAYSFTPHCSMCKHFIPDNQNPVFGLCNMFQDTVYQNDEKILVQNLAIHCRNNENLCGSAGFLYEPIKNDNINKTLDDYEYIKSVCSNEFVEDHDLAELEKLEKDLVEVFQKMRRHNKKIIYKNVGHIYKLFKKRDE